MQTLRRGRFGFCQSYGLFDLTLQVYFVDVCSPVFRGETGSPLVQGQSLSEELDRFGTGRKGEFWGQLDLKFMDRRVKGYEKLNGVGSSGKETGNADEHEVR